MCTNCDNCADCGNIVIPTGEDGSAGVGIDSTAFTNGDLVITYTDATTQTIPWVDDWNLITDARGEFTSLTFTGSSGCVLNAGGITVGEIAWHIIDSNTVAIKGCAVFKVDINAEDQSFDYGQFTLDYRWGAFTSSVWFTGNKYFNNLLTIADMPVAITSQLTNPTTGDPTDLPAGLASQSYTFGGNRIVVTSNPTLTATGTYTINLGFCTTASLQDEA